MTAGDKKTRGETRQNRLESWLEGAKLVFVSEIMGRAEVIILVVWGEGAFCCHERVGLA